METFLQTLTLVQSTAWSIYLGIIASFAILGIFSRVNIRDYLVWFRKFGVILGLSLGATLLSTIALIWFERGSYYPVAGIETIGVTFGFAMWVSNIILEIWTLDPIRKFDLNILDAEVSIEEKEQKSMRHIRLHALLCLGMHVCFVL